MLGVIGDLAETVTACPLSPAVCMPDTNVAWPAQVRPELVDAHAAAREVARELYRSSSISP